MADMATLADQSLPHSQVYGSMDTHMPWLTPLAGTAPPELLHRYTLRCSRSSLLLGNTCVLMLFPSCVCGMLHALLSSSTRLEVFTIGVQ